MTTIWGCQGATKRPTRQLYAKVYLSRNNKRKRRSKQQYFNISKRCKMKGAAKSFKSYPSFHHPLRYQTSQGPACQVTCSLIFRGNPWISAGHPPKRMCFRAFCLKQMAFSSSVRVTTGLYTMISHEDVGSTMANWEFYVGPQ